MGGADIVASLEYCSPAQLCNSSNSVRLKALLRIIPKFCPYCARPMLVAETQTVPLNARVLLQQKRALAAVDTPQDPKAHHDDQH